MQFQEYLRVVSNILMFELDSKLCIPQELVLKILFKFGGLQNKNYQLCFNEIRDNNEFMDCTPKIKCSNYLEFTNPSKSSKINKFILRELFNYRRLNNISTNIFNIKLYYKNLKLSRKPISKIINKKLSICESRKCYLNTPKPYKFKLSLITKMLLNTNLNYLIFSAESLEREISDELNIDKSVMYNLSKNSMISYYIKNT